MSYSLCIVLSCLQTEQKFKNKKQIMFRPMGVWDAGNGCCASVLKEVEDGKITANEACLKCVMGEREGVGNSSKRRVNLCAPFLKVVDPSCDACEITNPYFERIEDILDDDDELVCFLLLSFCANLICRNANIASSKTDLHHELMSKWVYMNANLIREDTQSHFEPYSTEKSVNVCYTFVINCLGIPTNVLY
jgi:hypothetical protein